MGGVVTKRGERFVGPHRRDADPGRDETGRVRSGTGLKSNTGQGGRLRAHRADRYEFRKSVDAVEMSYLIRFWVIMICVSAAILMGATPVFAQLGQPGPSSPLYGARPSSGSPSTGLPTALREVRIEQKLNQQLPLDLLVPREKRAGRKLQK